MSIFSVVVVVFLVFIHSHSTPAFLTRYCDSFFSTSLSMQFVFAFMFHLFLSLFLLFGIVDARAATVNPLQIFRLNDRRCNVIFFYHHHRRLFFLYALGFVCLYVVSSRRGWLAQWMQVFFFLYSISVFSRYLLAYSRFLVIHFPLFETTPR